MIWFKRLSASRAGLQTGATLLEVMLVLSIAGLLFVVGIKTYEQFQNTLSIEELRDSVDQLFQAAGNYYQANCAAGSLSPKPPVFLSPYPANTGTIDYPPSTPVAISIANDLIANGYLENWHPLIPIVSQSGGESGFVVQFNPIVSSVAVTNNACVVFKPGTKCVPVTPPSTTPITQARVVTWAIQIAVKVTPKAKAGGYAALLSADCISGVTGTAVDPCPSGNPNRDYLVWKKMPAVINLKRGSVYTTSMPLLAQFNQQYNRDKNYAFNQGYSSSTSPSQAPVYYLCGG